jgi:hypothetical protein
MPAALAALAFVMSAGAQQEPIAVRGTSVTLTPPAGFAPSRTARTLENAATGSTITVSEGPGNGYEEMAARFSSAKSLTDGYAQQGITIRSVRRIDGKIPFAVGRQEQRGKVTTKYFALLQGDKTVLLTFTIMDRTFTEADAEAVARSVEIAPAPTVEERLSTLPFTFTLAAPYTIDEIIPRQAVQLEVEGRGEQPAVVIGYGRSQALMGDEARVAPELLRNTGGYREAQIVEQGPTAFAGGNGYLIKAVVEDRTAIQYLRIIAGGGYLRLLVRGKTSAIPGVEAAIAEIASSVEPR